LYQEFQNPSVQKDSSKTNENYVPKLNEIGHQLDSLTHEQEKITVKLDSLKFHAQKIKKEQLRGDLINVGLFILFIVIIVKLFFLKKKHKTK